VPANHANRRENSLKKKIIRANSCDSRADLSFSLIPRWNALSLTRWQMSSSSEKPIHRIRGTREFLSRVPALTVPVSATDEAPVSGAAWASVIPLAGL
jgi:hypothetical protein